MPQLKYIFIKVIKNKGKKKHLLKYLYVLCLSAALWPPPDVVWEFLLQSEKRCFCCLITAGNGREEGAISCDDSTVMATIGSVTANLEETLPEQGGALF